MVAGHVGAQEKYGVFMRHRYSGCVDMLLELLEHQRHRVAVSEMMKTAEAQLCCDWTCPPTPPPPRRPASAA